MPSTYPISPFKLLAADLSLRRPAFTILDVNPHIQAITVDTLVDIDNSRHEPRGLLLKRIHDMTCQLSVEADVFVREGGFIIPNDCNTCLFEVSGVTDLALWSTRSATFADVPATQVKKLIRGRGTATKEGVASGLWRYIGFREFENFDQSDAIAVGISWLIITGIVKPQPQGYSISKMATCSNPYFIESVNQLLCNMRRSHAHAI